MSVELGTAYISLVPSTKGVRKSIAEEFGQGGEDAAEELSKAGEKAGRGFSSGFGSVVSKAGLLTGAAAAGIGVGLFKLGSTFDDAFDHLRVGTGKTGEELAGLQDSFRNIAQDVPSSFGEISDALTQVSQRLGTTGPELESLSTQFLNLSRITGTDLGSNITSATRLFGDWSIATENQGDFLDQLFRASQQTGVGLDELSQSLVQFGAPLRNLGFSFQESEALLGTFAKTGVNTETVMAGLKAGVGKLAKAGEPIPATFRRVVDEITKLGPGSAATGKAIELFGQRAGPDLADAITGGKFAFDDLMHSIVEGDDTINGAAGDTADFAESWQTLKNRVFLALEPIATKFFTAVGQGLDKLGPIFTEAIGGLYAFQSAWVANDGDVTSSGFPGLMEKLANILHGKVVPAIGEFVGWLRDLWTQHGPQVVAVITTLFDGIRTGIEFIVTHQPALIAFGAFIGTLLVAAFIGWAVAAASAAAATIAATWPVIAIAAAIAALTAGVIWAYKNWGWFHDAVDAVGRFMADTLWPILKAVGEFLITTLVPAIVKVVEWLAVHWFAALKLVIGVIAEWWRSAVEAKDFITGAFDAVLLFVAKLPGQLASAAKGLWDWITEPFRDAMAAIRKLWNDTIGGFSFSIPDWIPIPGVAGKTFSVPKLHSGGWVPGTPGADVPILAQAGEFVLSRADVAAMQAGGPGPGGNQINIGTIDTGGRPLLEQLVELQHLLPAA